MTDLPRNFPGKHALMILIVSVLILASFLTDHYVSSGYTDFGYIAPILVAAIILSPLETVAAGLLVLIFELTTEGVPFELGDIASGSMLLLLAIASGVAAYYVKRHLKRLRIVGQALQSSPLAYAEFEFPGYRILRYNPAFAHMLEAEAGTLPENASVFNSFPRKVADDLSGLMDQAINIRAEVAATEFPVTHNNGRAEYWNVNLIPEDTPMRQTPHSLSLLATDVTEALHRTRTRDAALRITSAVMSSLNLEETMHVVLDSLAYIAQTNAGALFLIEDDQWIGMAGWGEYNDETARQQRWPYDDLPTGIEAVEGKRALAIEDAAADGRFSMERVRRFEIRSSMVVPLVAGNRPIGAAWLNQTDQNRRFSEEQIEFATVIGSQGALAIENAQIYENERTMRKSLEAIEAISEVGLNSLDLDEVLIELVTRTQDVMQMDAATIFLADEKKEFLEVRAATGSGGASVSGARIRVEAEGLAGRAFREGVPLKIDDVSEQKGDAFSEEQFRKSVSPFSESQGIRSALAVPLRPGGKIAGVLQLGSQRPGAFSAREWGLIQVLADRASMAVQNSLMYDKTRNELARSALLRDVAAACADSEDIHEISERALDAIYEQLGCHRTSLYYFDKKNNCLVSLAFRGHTDEVMERFRISPLNREGLLPKAVRERRMITQHESRIDQLTESEAYIVKAMGVEENRRCTLPLMYKGEVVGGMALIFPDCKPFSARMIDTIQGIGNQLAVAIHGSQLPPLDEDELRAWEATAELAALDGGSQSGEEQ